MTSTKTRATTLTDRWRDRVDGADWAAVTAEIDEYGGALLPQLLTPEETAEFRGLYDQDELFRSTINMGRHRFGEGQYEYFVAPYPEPIERLKQALYPRLLPIARDWWTKLGRPAPWPDTLDEWLAMCHDAGQTKSTATLLRYGEKDWNALPRDLYGDLVFPLQVVINLNEPGVDHTGGEFLLLEQRPRAQSRGTASLLPHGHGYLFTTRDRPVRSTRGWSAAPVPSRRVRHPIRPAPHLGPRLPRRGMSASKTAVASTAKSYTLTGADGRPYSSPVKGEWGGHRGIKIYGRLDCPAALRAIARGGYVKHRVFFADEGIAILAGFRPCGACCKDRYSAWKDARERGEQWTP